MSAAYQQAQERSRREFERAKEAGKEQLEARKNVASERTSEVAGAVDRAGEELSRQGEQRLGAYAANLAASLDEFADKLRSRSIDDLTAEAQELARRNPALFLAGSVGIGFALARFLKASPTRRHPEGEAGEFHTTDPTEGL